MRDFRLIIMVSLAFVLANALPTPKPIMVGQYFELPLPETTTVKSKSGDTLPSWLRYHGSALQGIPTEQDIGKHTLLIKPPGLPQYSLKITVQEEGDNKCGSKESYWVEAFFQKEDTLANRIEVAVAYAEEEKSSDSKTLRIYSPKYATESRDLEEMMKEEATGNFIALWVVACGDFEEATNVFDLFLEKDEMDYDSVKLTKGFYKKGTLPHLPSSYRSDELQDDDLEEDELEKTVEELRTTTELVRTTRRNQDNKPILLNRLPSYTCTRGENCELRVPSETFKDAEDGDTFKLSLTILPLDNAEIWMVVDQKGMRGVPMRTGEYNYRLEARDKAGQLASAAFQVNVKPALPTNHKIQFDMDMPSAKDMISAPQKRNLLMNAMSRSLKAPISSFTLQDIGEKNGKTVITWSNNTLPYKTCDEAGLNAMAGKMIIKQKMRTKTEFVKAMGNQFYVRKASLIRLGNCEEEVEISTTVPTVQSLQEADSKIIVICVLLFLLLVLVVGLIVYCACFKTDGKKKAASTEYVAKGLPVVFPDEVDESDPTHAGTPMLAREERPPLKVSQHENPLYKPPPPIASNSPRFGHSSSSNQKMTSAFIPP